MKDGAAVDWFIFVIDGHLLEARLNRSDGHHDQMVVIAQKVKLISPAVECDVEESVMVLISQNTDCGISSNTSRIRFAGQPAPRFFGCGTNCGGAPRANFPL